MAADSLTPEIRRFVARHIQAVEQVEILCLLAENADRSWSVAETCRRIQSSERSVAECLATFQKTALVTLDSQGAYRLSRENLEANPLIGALVKAYRERRVSVIECIYNKPADSIQDFADAFRLRKEK